MTTESKSRKKKTIREIAHEKMDVAFNVANRIITSVSAKKKDDRPPEGTFVARPEYLNITDDVTTVPGTDRQEPVALMSMLVDHEQRTYRLYYRNPVSFLRRDLPRLEGFYENGGLKAIINKPETLKNLRATINITYGGDNKQFTNVRITGTAAYSPVEKQKLSMLAAMMGESVPTTPQAVTNVPV